MKGFKGYPDDWTLIGTPKLKEVADYEITYGLKTNELGEEEIYEAEKKKVGSHKETVYYYTDENGKERTVSDSERYKALGNSIAIPQWYWLFQRMAEYLEPGATLTSLFDGIGGFPLAWETIHGKGTAINSAEIEPFCIAVLKERFDEKT